MMKTLGPNHISTLQTVHNLGNLYKDQGKLEEAETMYEWSLTGNEKSLGPDHPTILDTIHALGILYVHQKKGELAETMFYRALTGYQGALGQGDPSTLRVVHNLWNFYRIPGELEEFKAAIAAEVNFWNGDNFYGIPLLKSRSRIHAGCHLKSRDIASEFGPASPDFRINNFTATRGYRDGGPEEDDFEATRGYRDGSLEEDDFEATRQYRDGSRERYNNRGLMADPFNRTPLSWAAEEGHEGVVQLLLNKNADIESEGIYDRTPLSWAAEKGREVVVKVLLDKNVNIESKDTEYGRTPLLWAAGSGFEVVVELLLQKNADVDSKDRYGYTALILAARNRHEAVVELFRVWFANKLS